MMERRTLLKSLIALPVLASIPITAEAGATGRVAQDPQKILDHAAPGFWQIYASASACTVRLIRDRKNLDMHTEIFTAGWMDGHDAYDDQLWVNFTWGSITRGLAYRIEDGVLLCTRTIVDARQLTDVFRSSREDEVNLHGPMDTIVARMIETARWAASPVHYPVGVIVVGQTRFPGTSDGGRNRFQIDNLLDGTYQVTDHDIPKPMVITQARVEDAVRTSLYWG